jgi:hypothetical protein
MKSLHGIDSFSTKSMARLKGLEIVGEDANLKTIAPRVESFLHAFRMTDLTDVSHDIDNGQLKINIKLKEEYANTYCPQFSTLNVRKLISNKFQLPADTLDELEILIALMASPLAFTFQSVDSLESHIRYSMHEKQLLLLIQRQVRGLSIFGNTKRKLVIPCNLMQTS